jgi:hypothetical protein
MIVSGSRARLGGSAPVAVRAATVDNADQFGWQEGGLAFFSVLVEARADDDREIDRAALRAFAAAVEPYHASVSGAARSWSARISVEAAGAADGAALGVALVILLARQAELPEWPIVRAGAVREDVFVEDLAQPQLPDLVSAPEAAQLLQVSVPRLHQLAAGHQDFPAPAYELAAATLWLRPAIVTFSEHWERERGTPRTEEPEGA